MVALRFPSPVRPPMPRSSESPSAEEKEAMTKRISTTIAGGLLVICAAILVYGLIALPRTPLAFALVFGGGVIAYESVIIISRAVKKARSESAADIRTPADVDTLSALFARLKVRSLGLMAAGVRRRRLLDRLRKGTRTLRFAFTARRER
jgi:hypothetical protein